MYVKPYMIIGSKQSNQLKLLIPNSLEIIRIFEFEGYSGGFIDGEVLGEILYEKSFIFGEVLALACTDGQIRFINLHEELQSHPKGKQQQGEPDEFHFPKLVILKDVSQI